MGTIYTFYSYKGGVGRSMCLANVATLLAKWGRRVLIIDWDLEAPGIEEYFKDLLPPGVSSRRGLLDIIESFSLSSSSKPFSWQECVVDVPLDRLDSKLNLSLITGGSRKNGGGYITKLQEIDWDALFEFGFGKFLEEMRREWIAEFDFVFIDSRTGFTDMGGICTIFLPDALILLFTANRQSLGGALEMLERSREARARLPVDRSSLVAIPVAARDESRTEYALAKKWRKDFSEALHSACADWLPKGKTAEDWFEALRLPHIPYWSFGEPLPVLTESAKDIQSLSYGYYVLARLIESGLDWEKAMGGPVAESSAVAESWAGESNTKDTDPLDSPYRGLLSFRESDAPFYFGREDEILLLRSAVEKNSLTALVGPSGSGKSSLVHAGLLPNLRASKVKDFWQMVSMRPGPHPIFSLASCLNRLLDPEAGPEVEMSAVERLAGLLMKRAESLESISVKASQQAGKISPLLLVVDQWEELYTLAQDNQAETERFVEEILAATRSNWVSVLILFRGDFYGRVMEHRELRRRLQGDSLISLQDMSPDDLRRAVVEPARKVGFSFDDGLVDKILQDLEHQPGQLPLLEFVLTRLWDERDERRRKLLNSSYESMGRLRGALAREADEIARTLPEEEVRHLFLRLVRVEEDAPATRRRAHLGELDPRAREVASRFIEGRLLVTGWDSRTGEEIVEIAHEALVHHWRRLRAWQEEDRAFLIWRDQLDHDVAEWMDSGKKDGFLLAAGPLQVAEFWFGKHANNLSAEAHAYIRLSIEKREREERLRRFFRSAAVVLVVTLLALVGTVVYLRAVKKSARSAALAAEASRLADRKLDLALLLALQARKVKPTAEALVTTLSLTAGNSSLRHFLRHPQAVGQQATREEILAVAFGPGGLIATGGEGRISLWDAKMGILHGKPLEIGESEQVVSLAFSPDGFLLASGSDTGGLIRLWDIREGRELDPIRVDGSAQNLTFNPSAELVAWSTHSGIYLWDLAREALVMHFPTPSSQEQGNWFSSLAFRSAGGLVAAMANGRLWEAGRGPQLQPFAEVGNSVMGVAFSPDGTLLSAGTSFQRWELSSGRPIGKPCSLLTGPNDEVISATFSQDRRFVASSHIDRKIRIWDVSKSEGCSLVATLSGHSGFIWSMAFGGGRQGKRLSMISGGQDGDVIFWEINPQEPSFSIPLGARSPVGLATLAVSRDGSLVAVGDSVGQVTLYDGKTRARLDGKSSRNRRPIFQMAFSGDGRTLATGGPESHVLLWDVAQRDLRVGSLLRAGGGEDSIRSLAFSQDSTWIAAGTKNGKLLVWNPAAGNTPALPPQKLQAEPVVAMAFVTETGWFSQLFPILQRKQKELLVTGGSDGRLTLWDLEGGRKFDPGIVAHSQAITSLAARPDGLLASGSLDRSVRLWRLDNGLRPEDTLFLGWNIMDLDLSPRGELLAAAADNEIVLWNLKTRVSLGNAFQAPGSIRSVAFDPNEKILFLGGKGIAAWWNLSPDTWASQACDMVRRELSPVEQEMYLKPSERPVSCPVSVK
jgi:WD40 repeat protein/cellulose biosynthesis protein BcsQ/energy-coupling factor transporter ATP-binding protein EcfA2